MTREYGLRHSTAELQRLSAQATLLDPFTFAPGCGRPCGDACAMDAGCGNGDVTMLVAGMVGPLGIPSWPWTARPAPPRAPGAAGSGDEVVAGGGVVTLPPLLGAFARKP